MTSLRLIMDMDDDSNTGGARSYAYGQGGGHHHGYGDGSVPPSSAMVQGESHRHYGADDDGYALGAAGYGDAFGRSGFHPAYGSQSAAVPLPPADRRSRAQSGGGADASIKLTPVTGRVSRAKKGMPVHICEDCDPPKTFTRAEHLRRHQLSHGKPQFVCPYRSCERAFHRADLLQRHQHRHETDEGQGGQTWQFERGYGHGVASTSPPLQSSGHGGGGGVAGHFPQAAGGPSTSSGAAYTTSGQAYHHPPRPATVAQHEAPYQPASAIAYAGHSADDGSAAHFSSQGWRAAAAAGYPPATYAISPADYAGRFPYAYGEQDGGDMEGMERNPGMGYGGEYSAMTHDVAHRYRSRDKKR